MKILIIGGTGRISFFVSKCLVREGNEVYLLNRGRSAKVVGAFQILGDIDDYQQISLCLNKMYFDVVIDFIAFNIHDMKKRYKLFTHKTYQYIFISSMTVCNTSTNIVYNEKTPVGNPYSRYARNKIECENYLNNQWKKQKFPITIIRPSHTYNDFTIPLGIHGQYGSWQNVKRMMTEKKVIIHGDGTSIWSVTRSEDFAEWLLSIVGNKEAIGETIQITADEMMTWNKIYLTVADECGKKLNPFYISSEKLVKKGEDYNFTASLLGDKTRTMIFDNSKLKSYSQYKPKLTMEEGIRHAVCGVLKFKEYQKEDIKFEHWCDRICIEEE